MADSRTEAILTVSGLPGGGSRVIGHGLHAGRRGLIPDEIQQIEGSAAIVVTAHDTMAVTFTNLGYTPATARFRVRVG